MLTRIADVLKVEAADLLPGVPAKRSRGKASEEDGMAIQLQAAFARIKSNKERRIILDLAPRLSDDGPAFAKKSASRPKTKRRH